MLSLRTIVYPESLLTCFFADVVRATYSALASWPPPLPLSRHIPSPFFSFPFTFPFFPIQLLHFPLPVASCLPFPCLWPCASPLALVYPHPPWRLRIFAPSWSRSC